MRFIFYVARYTYWTVWGMFDTTDIDRHCLSAINSVFTLCYSSAAVHDWSANEIESKKVWS